MPDPRGPSRYYTVKDLAEMWRTSCGMIRWYLWAMTNRHELPPRPGQTRIKHLNSARRLRLIREDYATLIQRHFIDPS